MSLLMTWNLWLFYKLSLSDVQLVSLAPTLFMEGVWVALRRSLTMSPMNGSELIKTLVAGPRGCMRFAQSSWRLLWSCPGCHASAAPLSRGVSPLLKRGRPENSVVFHLCEHVCCVPLGVMWGILLEYCASGLFSICHSVLLSQYWQLS